MFPLLALQGISLLESVVLVQWESITTRNYWKQHLIEYLLVSLLVPKGIHLYWNIDVTFSSRRFLPKVSFVSRLMVPSYWRLLKGLQRTPPPVRDLVCVLKNFEKKPTACQRDLVQRHSKGKTFGCVLQGFAVLGISKRTHGFFGGISTNFRVLWGVSQQNPMRLFFRGRQGPKPILSTEHRPPLTARWI